MQECRKLYSKAWRQNQNTEFMARFRKCVHTLIGASCTRVPSPSCHLYIALLFIPTDFITSVIKSYIHLHLLPSSGACKILINPECITTQAIYIYRTRSGSTRKLGATVVLPFTESLTSIASVGSKSFRVGHSKISLYTYDLELKQR